jgi:iron complex outermembrane recepter protein
MLIGRIALYAGLLAMAAGPALAQESGNTSDLDFLLGGDDPVAPSAATVAETEPEPRAEEPSAPEPQPYTDTIAVAEEAETVADVAPRRANRFVEEIVVTAQKREENLQDVPISVQAFSGDLLDAKGIDEPKALQLTTPGLQYNVFAGYSLIYIRGVGTDAFIPSADASVATYIDNIYYPFGHALASSLGSIERVEVLKGPQGTLFGRNSTGGAINIVSKRPGAEFEADVQVSHESYNKTNLRAYANIPLTDSFGFSVSGLSYTEEQYYRLAEASPRNGLPDETSRAFSAKLGWRPGDALDVMLGYTRINTRGGLSMSLPVGDVRPLGVLAGVQRQPDYVTSEDAPVYIDSVSRVFTADVQYSAPWFDLRLLGGKQQIESPALADYDGSNQPLTSFEALGQFADVRTGEFQILSNDGSWGSDWLTWIGGVYYIDSSAGYDPLLFSAAGSVLDVLADPPPGGLLDALSGLTVPLISGLGSVSDLVGIPLDDIINGGVTLNLQGVLDTESTAYFAQATANLTDRLALTLGGRYQTETRTLAKSTTRYVPNASNPHNVIPVFDFNTPLFGTNGPRTARTSNFSPKVVLDYKFSEGSMVYGSYSKGFKSGTFNIIAIYQPPQYIEPEEVSSYELGYKGTLLDGALRFNAAVFQNDIENLQVQTISLTSGGAVRFETAGKASIRGAEFDLTWQILPDTLPGLVLTAGAAWLDSEYTQYPDGSGFDESTGLFFDGTIFPTRDFSGNEVVRTPELSGNAGLSYAFDIGRGSVELAGDIYYNSGSFYSAQNTASSEEDSYHVVNARASYFYEPWGLRLTVFGKNITDARYHYVIADLDFGSPRLLAPPATYGVRLKWAF